MKKLLSVAQASKKILSNVKVSKTEYIKLAQAQNRVLAKSLKAKRTQPPFNASAMDGYAVRANDKGELKIIGTSAAGHGFAGTVKSGQCVRIFTGAPMPKGTNAILIQEHTMVTKNKVLFLKNKVAEARRQATRNKVAEARRQATRNKEKKYVRQAGGDFKKGEQLLKQFQKLDAGELSLAAAMNYATVPVQKKPVVAIIATGDELVEVGKKIGKHKIVSSNAIGVASMVEAAGGVAVNLGIAKDSIKSLQQKFNAAKKAKADIVVTLGGASVGEHDLVREVLQKQNVKLDFWKLAMRPGKPVMFGKKNQCRYIGLPGNPVSSLVCTQIFVVPLIRKILGLQATIKTKKAILGLSLPANDEREEYMRATSSYKGGKRIVVPVKSQDSSLLSLYTSADCLLVRPANSAKMARGSHCKIIDLLTNL